MSQHKASSRGSGDKLTGDYFSPQCPMCLLCGSLAPMTTDLGPAGLRDRARFHNDEALRLEGRAVWLEKCAAGVD